MRLSRAIIALAVGSLVVPLIAGDRPQPGYKVGDLLQPFFREYRVSGPGVEKPGETYLLVCTYSTRPVVMVYTRDLNGPLIKLIKKLDEATAAHAKDRMGSYVVLICESQEREKELLALAEKEKIRHTLLSLVVIDKDRHERFNTRFGEEAETNVILATKNRVAGSYAFRKGEMTDKNIEQIIADVPKIFPKKD